MLMFNENGGFHNFQEEDVAQAKKDGWVDGATVRDRLMKLKSAPVAVEAKPDTITAQPAPRSVGRPRKEATSFNEV